MFDQIIAELEKIGLSDKEARVYLAALELGTATAQNISAKATVNRPTTYVAVESLIKRGMMSSVIKGKKRYFVAETPDKIYGMLQDQKRSLEEKEGRVAKIMADLKALASGSETRSETSTFEGQNGIERMREDIQRSKAGEIFEFIPLDLERKLFPSGEDGSSVDYRAGKASRIIYAAKGDTVPPSDGLGLEWRPIPDDQYPFEGHVIICGNLVSIISYRPKPVGVQIDNAAVANTFRQIFRLAWQKLD